MKKFLPTLILLIVLIGGYAYAKSENFFKEEVKTDQELFAAKGTDVKELKLGTGEAAVQLKRIEGGWEMTSPEAYPVEAYAADAVAEAFGTLTVKGVVDEAPANLGEFGLDDPLQVEAILSNGSKKTLLIGNPLPVSGTTYIKTGDANTVYEVNDTVLSNISKTAEDFLDKNVFKVEYDKVTAIQLEWKGEKWTLTKADPAKKAYESAWKLGDKELKPEEGSGVLDQLIFLSTDRLPKKREEVDWASPELKLTIAQGEGAAALYEGKIDNQLVRVAKSDGAFAFALGASDMDTLAGRLKELQTAEAASANPAPASPSVAPAGQ
ncbi:MAG: hypothetical protein K0Q90_392 [Paenibacillaceae bacterium]|nr:hypothetical protein [Paenibacillaceae bacterium]